MALQQPLTKLLKKNQFKWNDEAKEAFQMLESEVTQPLVLALPNFSLPFVIKCDALRAIGVVLM